MYLLYPTPSGADATVHRESCSTVPAMNIDFGRTVTRTGLSDVARSNKVMLRVCRRCFGDAIVEELTAPRAG